MAITRPNAVDNHPAKAQIIQMILSGHSPKAIAAQIAPPIRYSAIDYYKRKILPYNPIADCKPSDISEKTFSAVSRMAENAVSEGDFASLDYHRRRLLARLEGMDSRRALWLIEAQADRHWTACAQLDGINIRSLELQARLLGLDQAPAVAAGSMVISFTSNNIAVSHKPAELPAADVVETIDITPVDS